MRRLTVIIISLLLSLTKASASYVHVDFDYVGALQVEATYLALAKAEGLNTDNLNDILNHYTSAEVATAGIWLSKFMERKALKDEMLFSTAENHYYKVILFLVTKRISPRIVNIGKFLLHYPEQFLYWGPFLYKTADDVMNLCAQFEAIVTNGKLGFSSSDFVQICPALQGYFDLSKLGNVNWQETWDRITNFPTPKWEDFREDFKDLFGAVSPVNIAIAGEESIKGQASHIFDKFAEAPESIPELIENVEEAFSDITSGAAIREVLEGVIGDLKDSLAINRLLDVGKYNVGNYVKDYVSQLKGEFYTQLWYIYYEEKKGGNYYTQNYVIKKNGDTVYSMEYDSRSNKGDFDKKMTEMVAAYRNMYPDDRVEMSTEARVNHYVGYGQGRQVIVYDELFDSRVNHETVFEKEFNKRIDRLMKDQEVDYEWQRIEYKLGKGEKNYYEYESSETVRNTSSASFSVSCHDEVELAKGGFNFKVNERFNESKMKDYAYYDHLAGQKKPEDLSLLYDKMDDFDETMDDIKDKISDYEFKIDSVQAIADTIQDQTEKRKLLNLKTQYNSSINSLNREYYRWQDSISLYNRVISEYRSDYSDELDGPYRIPQLVEDLEEDFHLKWDDEGQWSGNTYIRHGHIIGMEGSVKLVAEVKKERGESRFFGIRFHRAIVGVNYRLVSDYETSEVAAVVEFTDDMTDAEKANLINQKRSEVQSQFPQCNVTVVKKEKEPPEKDDKQEALHLLWMSDRIALARFIEYRLRQIDGQLALIERNLYVKKDILEDFKRAFLQGTPHWRANTPYGAALQRWLNIGNGIAANNKNNN